MSINAETTVREIAIAQPASIRVFERFGIDYCCGGRKPLIQACDELQLSVEQVLEKLEEVSGTPAGDETAWQSAPLSRLIQHIVRKHHTLVRQESPRLRALADKVRSRHGAAHPELLEIESLFGEVATELSTHMLKEEQILFPYIARMEHTYAAGMAAERPLFVTVENPIRTMVQEHENAGALLASIRRLSNDFQPSTGACPSYIGLYHGLEEFERDLHVHVHLENNILFPRAQGLERETNVSSSGRAQPA
jgi:regulator of cell morphogenesis and NO signaling